MNVHSLLYNPKGVDKEIIYSMTCDGNRPIHNIQVTYTLGAGVALGLLIINIRYLL